MAQEQGASERAAQGRGAVGERRSSEQSEARRPDENKRHENEQGIKKAKLWCTSRQGIESLVSDVLFVALLFSIWY